MYPVPGDYVSAALRRDRAIGAMRQRNRTGGYGMTGERRGGVSSFAIKNQSVFRTQPIFSLSVLQYCTKGREQFSENRSKSHRCLFVCSQAQYRSQAELLFVYLFS